MKQVGHKIILCGIDGAGKSTIAKMISDRNPDMHYEIVHCTRHTPNTYKYFRELFLSEKNIIFDRGPYGQFVYQTREEREERDQLTVKQLLILERIIKELGIDVWYVYADLNTCLINCLKDSEDSYYTLDYLKELDIKFRNLFDSISSVKVKYVFNDYKAENSKNESNKIDYFNFDYSSLPKVVAVDFDGTLVYGEEFPKIGKLNTKLLYDLYEGEYKDWKKVLFTHRSDETLIAACNFLVDNNIYFDAINDDVKEIKDALNRNPIDHRKVWFDKLIDDKAENIDKYLDV